MDHVWQVTAGLAFLLRIGAWALLVAFVVALALTKPVLSGLLRVLYSPAAVS